jgi:hypothetical protein
LGVLIFRKSSLGVLKIKLWVGFVQNFSLSRLVETAITEIAALEVWEIFEKKLRGSRHFDFFTVFVQQFSRQLLHLKIINFFLNDGIPISLNCVNIFLILGSEAEILTIKILEIFFPKFLHFFAMPAFIP